VRALLYYGPGDLRVEEVPRPEPGPGDVLVQVEVALTDGTDAKAFRRGHPLLLADVPSPFGHEFCGIDVATGRRVVAANSAPCGECLPCRRGDETLCENLAPFLNGAYAEYLLIPARIAARNLLPAPPRVAPEVAALVEPLACCLRGVERADIQPGQTVAVLGPGPIGLMICAAAKDAGAHVVCVGGRPQRRELARDFGAEPGDGKDADVVGGREVAVDTFQFHYQELTVRGAFHHTPRHVRAALAFLASGAYPWERLVTHRVGLEGVAGLFADPPTDLLKAGVLP
jgi:L-iditol 2-dehydrogenase